jgi:hypothetical protein
MSTLALASAAAQFNAFARSFWRICHAATAESSSSPTTLVEWKH